MLQNGLVPVFLDVDIPTYNIRADRLESAITEKTRAIMIAHTLGNPFDLHTVMEVAKRHDLYVVEDTCDALGATYDGKLVGTFGDIGTLSFYPAHHITMGEGGAVFCTNNSVKRALESIRIGDVTAGASRARITPAANDTSDSWRSAEGYDHKLYLFESRL